MKQNRDIEITLSKKRFANILRRLADKIEQGKGFKFQIKGERLYIPQNVQLSIEHEREDKIEEIEIQIKWQRR